VAFDATLAHLALGATAEAMAMAAEGSHPGLACNGSRAVGIALRADWPGRGVALPKAVAATGPSPS
jgi:hypothetical protein